MTSTSFKQDKEDLIKELKIVKAQMAVVEEAEVKRKKRDEELSLLHKLTMDIAKSNNFFLALETTIQKVCEITKWEVGQVWTPSFDKKYLTCNDAFYLSDFRLSKLREVSKNLKIENGQGLPGRAWKNKLPVMIHDLDNISDTDFLRTSVAKTLQIQSAVAIPIMHNDEIIAIFEFFMINPQDSNLHYIDLVSVVAAQLGLVVGRKKIEQELKESKEYLQKQYLILQNITKNKAFHDGKIEELLPQITEASANTLDVSRVNVRLLSKDKTKLECVDLFDLSTNKHTKGEVIYAKDYPVYFSALEESRIMCVNDTQSDSRVVEFLQSHIIPLDIKSMLNAPIMLDGEVVGLICYDQVRDTRDWSPEEISFACSITDIVSSMIETRERKRVERKLYSSQQSVEAIVNGIDCMLWEVALDTKKLEYINNKVVDVLGYPLDDWYKGGYKFWAQNIHPNDRERALSALEYAMDNKTKFECEYRFITASGKTIWMGDRANILYEAGIPKKLCGVATDITQRKESELLLSFQSELLEMIAEGKDSHEVLHRLCRCTEEISEDLYSSILVLNKNRKSLYVAAAPSLPDEYNAYFKDGITIGPQVGSCGTAAYTGKTVIVSDISNDPLWKEYKDCALRFGFKACWSKPILSSKGDVVGTFAMYYKAVKNPTKYDIKVINLASYIAGLALEKQDFN